MTARAISAPLSALPAAQGEQAGHRDVVVLLFGALLLLALERTPVDLFLARLAGGQDGFPGQHAFWLEQVLHRGARAAGWVAALALMLVAARPFGTFRQLDRARRWQIALTPIACALAISILKQRSGASCPWDLAEFGGQARLIGHWAAFASGDGGPGRCFPAGHAVTGFGFIGGWYAWRGRDARIARRWLHGSLAIGLLLGFAQQWRGAHYLSHTLWSAWCCVATGSAIDALRRGGRRRLARTMRRAPR